MIKNSIGSVIESTPNYITVEIEDFRIFEKCKTQLQIGKYLKISDGNVAEVICSITNIKTSFSTSAANENALKYIIQTQPIGYIYDDKFIRGTSSIPSPTEPVFILDDISLDLIFNANANFSFPIGKLIQNNIDFKINPNNFLSKHIALVGSTGSGKSCTVAKIIQDIVGINQAKNSHTTSKNSHIIIFDIHAEYESAFKLDAKENFGLNVLNVDNLVLPYWLMNSEELESLFIESNESNSHNQVSQFKKAVILNKEKYNPSFKNINYDTPAYFNIEEVYTYLWNINSEVIGRLGNENCPKLIDGTLINDVQKLKYFSSKLEFVAPSTANATKATNGAFNGEFNRFLSRIETKLSDKRLSFIMKSIDKNKKPLFTDDFNLILKQFLGYLDKANISIIDLSGIPFEVLSISVSLISRLIFDFAFHYSKIKHKNDEYNDIPFMIVCEEAHNYIPKTGGASYNASKKSIERIAKEGRKYGLSLMVVSQRPSEVSDTIFSQCNNFISLRLTNINDQSYVKALMPENTSSLTDILPNLAAGECLVMGDATLLPAIVKLEMPNPEPKSQSIKFHDEWQKEWADVDFDQIINRWTKE